MLQSMGPQRVRYDLATEQQKFSYCPQMHFLDIHSHLWLHFRRITRLFSPPSSYFQLLWVSFSDILNNSSYSLIQFSAFPLPIPSKPFDPFPPHPCSGQTHILIICKVKEVFSGSFLLVSPPFIWSFFPPPLLPIPPLLSPGPAQGENWEIKI